MKKSLARLKQIPIHSIQQNDKAQNMSKQQKTKYRNQDLCVIPQDLKNKLVNIIILDISHNNLDNIQIDCICSTAKNLRNLQIQDNRSTLIPSSIWMLRNLKHFRHDWIKLFKLPEEGNLEILQKFCRKPDKIIKLQSISGINFETYCKQIMKISMNQKLIKLIQGSQCSDFAKKQMAKHFSAGQEQKEVKVVKKQGNFMMTHYPGCMMLMGFDKNQEQQKRKESPVIIKRKPQQKNDSKIIKINQIRNINEQPQEKSISDTNASYFQQELPLHNIFSKFDSLATAAMDVHHLLQKGVNPNQLDAKGLSIYHICVIHKQLKGLKLLFEINNKNPNLLNLAISSENQLRNISHYCIFLKNLPMLKLIIEQGFPLNHRDKYGARPVHLMDQNIQFMLYYRKLIKKNKNRKPMKKFRQKLNNQQKYIIIKHENLTLLDEYEKTVGLPRKKRY